MVKSQPADAGDTGSIPGLGRSPGEGNGTLVFLSWNAHGQRSLVDYGPWGHKRIGHNSTTKTTTTSFQGKQI